MSYIVHDHWQLHFKNNTKSAHFVDNFRLFVLSALTSLIES